MKRILIALAIAAFFCVGGHAQFERPLVQPQLMPYSYYRFPGYLQADSGILLPQRVANFTPKRSALIYDTGAARIKFYLNGWKALQDVAFTGSYTSLVDTPTNVTTQGNTFNGAFQLLQLDNAGKVYFANLPSTLMTYKGTWSAATNTPALANGTGVSGWMYQAIDSGVVDFGSGPITFFKNDYVGYNGSVWQWSPGNPGVRSVNGFQNIVSLTTVNIPEGGSVYYWTAARSRAAQSVTATGLTYDNSTGVISLTVGYTIPLTTDLANWNTAYSWGNWAAGSHYIGTTLIANNRASASQSLTGVSIDGTAGSETLATVTGRGASTSTAVSFNGGLSSTTGAFSGNVKVGTGTASYSTNLVVANTNTSLYINEPASTVVQIQAVNLSNTTTKDLSLQANGGNLGIGTTAPTDYGAGFKTLAINGASTGAQIDLLGGGTRYGFLSGTSTVVEFGSTTTVPVVFYSNLTDRGRITSSGNWLINTSTDDGSNKLQVNGGIRATGVLSATNTLNFTQSTVSSGLFNGFPSNPETLIDLHVNFRNSENTSYKGGSIRLDTRAAEPLFSFWYRAAASTSDIRVAYITETGAATFVSLAGSGNRILYANAFGTLGSMVIGSGLSFDGTTLSATGGSSGTVTGSGTSGIIPLWNSASDIGNSVMTQSGGNVSTTGTFSASSFSGAGTGLTGTASGLTAGAANVAYTWDSYSGVYSSGTIQYVMIFNSTASKFQSITAAQMQSWLGLGPAAYLNANLSSFTNDAGFITNTTSGLVNYYTATNIQNFFSGASAITGYNYTNWNTAYSWGNHAGLYLPLTGGTLTGALNGTTAYFTGTVTAGSFFEIPSDIRKKEVVQRWTSADGMDAIAYYLKDDISKKIMYGFEAQQVMKVLPTAVATHEDKTMPDGITYSVGYTQVLVYKIAMLEKRIENLENAIKK